MIFQNRPLHPFLRERPLCLRTQVVHFEPYFDNEDHDNDHGGDGDRDNDDDDNDHGGDGDDGDDDNDNDHGSDSDGNDDNDDNDHGGDRDNDENYDGRTANDNDDQ